MWWGGPINRRVGAAHVHCLTGTDALKRAAVEPKLKTTKSKNQINLSTVYHNALVDTTTSPQPHPPEMEFCVPLALEGVDKRGFDERHVCLFQRGELTCVKPPILSGGPLCKGITQCLCLEQRFALPCDDEVPCTVACCFVQCFREFKWEPKVMAEAPTVRISIGGGPQSEEMSR